MRTDSGLLTALLRPLIGLGEAIGEKRNRSSMDRTTEVGGNEDSRAALSGCSAL